MVSPTRPRRIGSLVRPLLVISSAILWGQAPVAGDEAIRPHGHMRPSPEARARFRSMLSQLPAAQFETPKAKASAAAVVQARATNLLPYVSTQGSIRDQGSNGDCWVWSSAALTEVELKAKYGFQDRLSTQFVDSLMSPSSWLNGGWFYDFASYVNQATILVPWANGNAAYADGNVDSYCTRSLITTSQIVLSPAYTQASLTASLLPTYGVGPAAAIAAIKSALDNHHAVAFDFYTNFSGTDGFDLWWAHNDETLLWPEPISGTNGMTYDPSTWGGHEVAIVGYDDSDPITANHYWLALNSWGTPTSRPSGCFRMPMVMNYDATYLDAGATSQRNYYFGTLSLTVDHPADAAPTVAVSPAATVVDSYEPFTLKGTVIGYPPFTYQWFNNGSAIPGATSAWFTDAVAATTDTGSYELVVTGSTGTPVASNSVQVVAEPVSQVLTNPGFETAPASTGADIPGWKFTSTGLPSAYVSPYRSSANAHAGSGYLFLGNAPDGNGSMASASGSVSQTMTIPTGGTPALALWVRMGTQETSPADIDTLSLQVQDTQGNVLQTLKKYTNQQTDHLRWAMDSFSLSAYQGQTVQVALAWNCPTATQTFWRVDDLALTVKTLDFNGSGVDVLDMATLAMAYGSQPASTNWFAPCDLNGDGVVNGEDVAIFLAHF